MRRVRWHQALAAAALALMAGAPGAALPAEAEALLAKARAALARSDGLGAEIYLRRALGAGAQRSEVAAAMGAALIDQDRLADARTWLAPGQFAVGQELDGWRTLAWLERISGDPVAAGRAYDRALAVAPKDSQTWVEIAQLRYAGGEQWQAIEAANRALAFGPRNPRAAELRAQLLRDQAGGEATLAIYAQALSNAPNDYGLLLGQAATLGELGRAKAMIAALGKARGTGQGLYLQAVLAARGGDVELARALINRAGRGYPRTAAAQELRALLELESGNANAAAGPLLAQLDQQPANQRLALLGAKALYESGQYQALVERFSLSGAAPDAPVYLLTLLGRAQEALGNRAAAAAWLDRAAAATGREVAPLAAANPGDAGSVAAAVAQVRQLLAARNPAAAAQVAESARKAHFGSADAQLLAGDAQLALGNGEAALDRYVAASQIRYTDALLLRMAQVLEQQGRPGEAGAATARYLAAFPSSRLAARLAANQRALAGDWKTARILLEHLHQQGGGRDARLLADLAFVQLRDGNRIAALASARAAWQLQPGSAVSAQALGLALVANREQPLAARQLLDQARALGGDNPLLAKARKELLAHSPG